MRSKSFNYTVCIHLIKNSTYIHISSEQDDQLTAPLTSLTSQQLSVMGGSRGDRVDPLLVGVLGVLSGAVFVAFIHCIAVNCRRSPPQTLPEPDRPPNVYRSPRIRVNRNSSLRLSIPVAVGASSSSGLSSIGLSRFLPVHKYTKEFKEGTCAVCLGEFEENEEVRIMPECTHIFHVSCIDMWLFSHDSCPLCRANATPRAHDVVLSILTSNTVR